MADDKRTPDQSERILQHVQDIVTVTDADGIVTYWNEAASVLHGIAPGDAIGRLLTDITRERAIEPNADEAIADAIGKGETWRGDVEVTRPDGSVARIEANLSPLPDRTGRMGAIEVSRDVTALRRESELLSAIVMFSPLPILTTDLAGAIQSISPSAERLFGYEAAELIGKRAPTIDPAEMDKAPDVRSRLIAGQQLAVDSRVITKDGTPIDVRIHAAPMRDRDGAMVGFVSFVEDIREQRGLEAQLRQAQKMEAIGRLAGGMAHDFNNILTAIGGYARLVESGIEAGDAKPEDIAQVIEASDRAAEMTRKLLAFSRGAVSNPRPIRLDQTIDGVLPMLRRLVPERIEIVREDRDPEAIVADPAEIEQALLNLVVNAVDAMPDGGRLTIATSLADLDDRTQRTAMGLSGSHVLLAVSDTGHGMDEATRNQIFEPFFTTKPVGVGTGLGLTTVYAMVDRAGGAIWVDSTPGVGTTFRIYFPRSPGAVEAPTVRARNEVGTGGHESILVVEDDELVRTFTTRILTGRGYRITAAPGPTEALAQLETDRFDLVVSDIVMPVMSGIRLAEHIRAAVPDMPILFVTGYTGEAGGPELGPRTSILQKPFVPQDLADLVRGLLDGSQREEPPGGPVDGGAAAGAPGVASSGDESDLMH